MTIFDELICKMYFLGLTKQKNEIPGKQHNVFLFLDAKEFQKVCMVNKQRYTRPARSGERDIFSCQKSMGKEIELNQGHMNA